MGLRKFYCVQQEMKIQMVRQVFTKQWVRRSRLTFGGTWLTLLEGRLMPLGREVVWWLVGWAEGPRGWAGVQVDAWGHSRNEWHCWGTSLSVTRSSQVWDLSISSIFKTQHFSDRQQSTSKDLSEWMKWSPTVIRARLLSFFIMDL